MRHPILVRAATAAVILTLAATSVAFADFVAGDGDTLEGPQGTVDLGEVSAGEVIERDVHFFIGCGPGTRHVDANQSVLLEPSINNVPEGGQLTFGGALLGPPGDAWPDDGATCNGTPSFQATGSAHVVMTAPTEAVENAEWTLTWSRTLTPAGSLDTGTFTGITAVTFVADVVDVANTPPVLTLPANLTEQGNTTGGWAAAWIASAADAEDDADPIVTCNPPVGEVLPVGTTLVTCAATDSGGLTASGSFTVTVLDTIAPVLHGVPSGLTLVTSNPAGAVLTYTPPTATDIVDDQPVVTCTPPPGELAPVGNSTVTCTATDANENQSSARFPVHVALAVVVWDEPIGTAGSITANAGRSIPLKARVTIDGEAVSSGSPNVVVRRCDGGPPAVTAAMAFVDGTGRWTGKLETSGLTSGCWRADLVVGDLVLGGFDLTIVGGGSEATKAKRQ